MEQSLYLPRQIKNKGIRIYYWGYWNYFQYPPENRRFLSVYLSGKLLLSFFIAHSPRELNMTHHINFFKKIN